MTRSVFVADQLQAATADNEQSLITAQLAHDRAHHVRSHPAESAIAATLAQSIAELPLCPHINAGTPTRLVWAPGMDKLGCAIDFIEHRNQQAVHRCDCCSTEVPRNAGATIFAVGPVMVFAIVCSTCLSAPSSDDADAAEAIQSVHAHLIQRWSA